MKTTFDPFLNSVRSVASPPSASPPALSGTNVSVPSQPGVSGAVDSVNGYTGAVILSKSDISLGNVTNLDTSTTANITDSSNKRFITDAQQTIIGNTSGTNTGDNATNTQYSGLASSKQDTLVSATNIKTVNGSSILGSGDLSISGGLTFAQVYSMTTLMN